jgi:succinate-semialdehyde dehydrogenase/glutarate-semialdehyde dehydrogenase
VCKSGAAIISSIFYTPASSGLRLGVNVSVKEHNKVAELVDSSIAAGSTLKTGGKSLKGAVYFLSCNIFIC